MYLHSYRRRLRRGKEDTHPPSHQDSGREYGSPIFTVLNNVMQHGQNLHSGIKSEKVLHVYAMCKWVKL